MEYTIYQILNQRLVMRKDGKPYTTYATLRTLLRDRGFRATKMNRGRYTYALTEKDIKILNERYSYPQID